MKKKKIKKRKMTEKCTVIPKLLERFNIFFCKFHCPFIHERGNGPAMLLPYSFCPLDQVKRAGPIKIAKRTRKRKFREYSTSKKNPSSQ